MPKVSVIIPVYNAKDYLGRCLDSVINQTLKDIEIICINDCSKDNSLEILKEYSSKDKRIKLINHKTNKGESAARNTGLDNAKGEYIAFLDNDDTIDSNFYEKLYKKATETNADIVKGEVKYINYDNTITYGNINEEYKKTKNKMTFVLNWWCAIYKRELIFDNNIRLLEGCILGGDSLFLNEAIINAKNFQIVDNVYYNYYRREDSGDSKILSFEKMKSALNVFELILNNINNSLNNKIITKEEYDFVFNHWFSSSVIISMRNNELSSKELCSKTIIKFANNCLNKDFFCLSLTTKFPSIYNFVLNNDTKGLSEFLYKNNTPFKFNLANIRSKHILSLEKTK